MIAWASARAVVEWRGVVASPTDDDDDDDNSNIVISIAAVRRAVL